MKEKRKKGKEEKEIRARRFDQTAYEGSANQSSHDHNLPRKRSFVPTGGDDLVAQRESIGDSLDVIARVRSSATKVGFLELSVVALDVQPQELRYQVPIYQLPSGILVSAWHNAQSALCQEILSSPEFRRTVDVDTQRDRIIGKMPELFSTIKGLFSAKGKVAPIQIPSVINQLSDIKTSLVVTVRCLGVEANLEEPVLDALMDITPREVRTQLQVLDSSVASNPKIWAMIVSVLGDSETSAAGQRDGYTTHNGADNATHGINGWGL